MANMSYCRFQNTRQDLADCIDAINQGETLSIDERKAGKRMFQQFLALCMDENIIEEYDEEELNRLFGE